MTKSFDKIFLIGYRGTGKSTVARMLAERLGWQCVDADALLEERAGRTIRNIFETDGEAAFRECENALIEELCRSCNTVIATGGGVVLAAANRAILRRAGAVVWLTAESIEIHRRLEQDPTSVERRPALTTGGLAEIEELLRVRTPFYRECANIAVSTDGRGLIDIADEILSRLSLSPKSP
jgi:shikimate kinase